MKRSIVMLLILLVSCAPARGWAQCTDWQPGPMDNGTAPNGAEGSVRAAVVWTPPGSSTSQLVIAGYFTSVQGVAASNIATLDPASGLWRPLGAGTNDVVHALTVYNGELIAGGSFTQAGGASANYAARWNGTSWQPLPYGTNPNGTNGTVYALTVYNNALILGGGFTQAGGLPAPRVISWTAASSFQGLGVGLNNGWVNAFALYNGELIVGGAFSGYVTRWNGSSWQSLPGGNPNNQVTSLQVFNGEVVVGGRFGQIHFPGGHIDVNYVARWNGASWQGLGTGVNYDVTHLGFYAGSLIAGGGFTTAGGVPAAGIARWSGASWQPLGSGLTHTLGSGFAMASTTYLGELIAGGGFDHAGGVTANNLARWDGAQWAAFGGGSAGSVFAMTDFIGRLVVGGSFHQYAGIGSAAHHIAGWDGVKMNPYGTGMNSTVFALDSFKYPGVLGDYELIAGGAFTQAGGVAANFIARWDQDPLSAFPPPAWAPGSTAACTRSSGTTAPPTPAASSLCPAPPP